MDAVTVTLPVVGSHAATTAFCSAQIEGPGGFLWLDGNGKVTAGNGTLLDPKPNAFSLLPGNTDARRAEGHCPGSTSVCRASCYTAGIEAAQAAIFELYAHNSAMLTEILDMPARRQVEWADVLGQWIEREAAGGFRWHVSGDVVSESHAEWIAEVCLASPSVRHWIYTRSFDQAVCLTEISNLALNLSCDADNYEQALRFRERFGGRLCYLTTDGKVPNLPVGSVIFPDYNLRVRDGNPEPTWLDALPRHTRRGVCPVDLLGKTEQRRCGPCSMCLSDPS